MTEPLREKIDQVLDSTTRMVLSTAVDGCASSASVFYARDGDDFLFFTFNPTRKARQIRFNPQVQMTIWPNQEQGIRGVRVEGLCFRISQPDAIRQAREKILAVTDAFKAYMDDEFLSANGVTGYYRIKPTRITHIDFYADSQFESLKSALSLTACCCGCRRCARLFSRPR